MFLELVRHYVSPAKLQCIIDARGEGTTLESALSPSWVYSLAMVELTEMFGLPLPSQ
jgi:hypothetical protein